MTCPKCGAQCIEGSTFCIKCGANLKEATSTPVEENVEVIEENNQPEEQIQSNVNNEVNSTVNVQPTQTVTSNTVTNTVSVNNTPTVTQAGLNYLMYIIAVLLKPFKCFKEEESKLEDPKNSLILTGIVSVVMMVVSLVKSMITVIFTKEMDMTTYEYKTKIDFSNLKNLKYGELIFKNLLIYLGIILGIALIYYLASLIIKKETKFPKLLATAASSILPFIVLGMIISPILGKIWYPLALATLVIGIVYSIAIFVNFVNDQIAFDNIDTKIYFHSACISIIAMSLGYLCYKLLIAGLASQLSNTFGMFS